jgi:hypothetical protein
MGCWLYTPGAVHGELGPRGGEGVGGCGLALAGVGGVDSASGVGGGFGSLRVPASPCTLAAERCPAGARQVSGGSGGEASRSEGEREGERAPAGSWLPPLSTCVS